MKRVFLAVNLPDETKERIAQTLIFALPKQGLRKVRAENLHITINFLGNTEEQKIGELKKKLKEIKLEKFSVELSTAGNFGNRVIWLGTGKGSLELKELNRKVMEATGLNSEKFHAHVALARNKSLKKEEILSIVEELNRIDFTESFEAESLDMMESVLTPSGAEYSVLEKISFL